MVDIGAQYVFWLWVLGKQVFVLLDLLPEVIPGAFWNLWCGHFLQLKGEHESRADSWLWHEVDHTPKLLDDRLADAEA